MNEEIRLFIDHLEFNEHKSANTIMSYRRDLKQLSAWLEGQGINEVSRVNTTLINSYLMYLGQIGKSTPTISRVLASTKAFFAYEKNKGKISEDPAAGIKSPKVEKKIPTVLTVEEVDRFLKATDGTSIKTIRDKAMLELMYATGIRVTELISLKLDDVNMSIGFITCKMGRSQRAIPFGRKAKDALNEYLTLARDKMIRNNPTDSLFVNCNGKPMSRQGLWKIIKYYGDKAGIQADITPQALRHSFAVHLIRNGADVHAVQEMLGHSDASTTHSYVNLINKPTVREVYAESHPRNAGDVSDVNQNNYTMQ